MKLVLFASFGTVLSGRRICVLHLIAVLQLSMPFMPHMVAQYIKNLVLFAFWTSTLG